MASWLNISALFVAGAGSGAGIGAVAYYRQQANALKEQLTLQTLQAERLWTTQKAHNDLLLMGHMMTLDRLFIEAPELRPYFYDAKELPDDQPLRARVTALAELIVDLADTVTNLIRLEQLDVEDVVGWEAALAEYGRSPAVRAIALNDEGAWRKSTLDLLLKREAAQRSLSDVAMNPSSRDAG